MSNHRQRRLEEILDRLAVRGTAQAKELADEFEVSVMTIHRDLDELERRGAVRKFHGGVTVARTRSHEISAAIRRRLAVEEKLALSRFIVERIQPNQTIMMDDSTTVEPIAELLAGAENEELRVITNSLTVINQLANEPGVIITALGGQYDPSHESFLGVGAVEAVRALRCESLFVSTTSVDADGIYHQEESVVALKLEMLRSARHRALLVDSTKFTEASLHRVCGWDMIDELVVTDRAPADLLARIADTTLTTITTVPLPPPTAD